METKEIIEILTVMNSWRRGAEIKMPDPEEFGIAIDEAINRLKEIDYTLINKNGKFT